MRCTCGYTFFVDRVRYTIARDEPRWAAVNQGGMSGGLGYAPLGTAGVPDASLWGRVDVDVHKGLVQTRCKSCARVRHEKPVGGGAALGCWASGTEVFLLMSDIVDSACARVQFRGQGAAYEVQVEIVDEAIPEQVLETVETAVQLPLGAVVAQHVYRAAIPKGLDGEYRILLLDRCLGVASEVKTLNL